MVATVALFVEYEAVLTRPEHLARAEITAAEAEIALDVLAAVVEPVESHFLWRPRLRDADDDMVLEAAANGQANRNRDLQHPRFRWRGERVWDCSPHSRRNPEEIVK
jgi:PIN domain